MTQDTQNSFNKYPKIPNQQKNNLPTGTYTVQEKLDGSNAGIELTGDGDLLIHTRNTLLAILELGENEQNGLKETSIQQGYGNFHQFVEGVKKQAYLIREYMRHFGYIHIYGE